MTMASYFRSPAPPLAPLVAPFVGSVVDLIVALGMSGRPSFGVEQRGTGDERVEVFVAVADAQLELHPRTGRGSVEGHAGQRDVPLEHRRVHLARRVAQLPQVIVVDVVLILDWMVVLGRDEPGRPVGAVVILPVDDEPAQLPA